MTARPLLSRASCRLVRGVKLYRIRIVPERAPNVSRTFEFAGAHRLHDVHRAIQSAFELDDDHLFAFYMSGKRWDKATEFAGGSTPFEPGRAAQVNLAQLGLTPGKRFSYVFDFGDEHWHSLEVESVEDVPKGPASPRLVEAIGEPPVQYEDGLPDLTEAELASVQTLVPIAEELLQLFVTDEQAVLDGSLDEGDRGDEDGEREGDDDGPLDEAPLDDGMLDLSDDDADVHPLEPEALRTAQGLAMRLARELNGDGSRLSLLERAVDADLLSYLVELPRDLADAEMVDAGLELASSLASLAPESFLGVRAVILAQAGRREEALGQLVHNLESLTVDAGVQLDAAEAYSALGDDERAEALLRQALDGTDDPYDRAEVVALLAELLLKQGRNAESAALLAEARAGLGEPDALSPRPRKPGATATAAVGRNDPCPCGSGKKFKKCCLV
jgi:hypothetical protein